MLLFLLFCIFIIPLRAQICDNSWKNLLLHIAMSPGENAAGKNAKSCRIALDHHNQQPSDPEGGGQTLFEPWCSCFKFPEAVDVVLDNFGDCRLDSDSTFTVKEAVEYCDDDVLCTDVPYKEICESKNCEWDSSTDACVGINPDRMDLNTAVDVTSNDLELPWVTDCELLLAIATFYKDLRCDDVIYELQDALYRYDNNSVGVSSEMSSYNTTIRDICAETCWFHDASANHETIAPFVFDQGQKCMNHTDCGNTDDYFCASCEKCIENGRVCGICSLTNYTTNVCVPMGDCRTETSIDGSCKSQSCEEGEDGNCVCEAPEAKPMFDVEACDTYFDHLDDDAIVKMHACDCYLNPSYSLDCVYNLDFLYTFNENRAFCNNYTTSCEEIPSKDACTSSDAKCKWIPRLVKGVCVQNPCYNGTDLDPTLCGHDSACLQCTTNAIGQRSCVPEPANEGNVCDDQESDTDNDVCTLSLTERQIDGATVWFACQGTNVETELVTPKRHDGTCRSGKTYECQNQILNYTLKANENCDNETIAVYTWKMDGECSNVMTTQAQSRDIYFRGTCHPVTEWTDISVCSEEEYLNWRENQSNGFVAPRGSTTSLSVTTLFSLLIVLLI